jgi:hypothetical protein
VQFFTLFFRFPSLVFNHCPLVIFFFNLSLLFFISIAITMQFLQTLDFFLNLSSKQSGLRTQSTIKKCHKCSTYFSYIYIRCSIIECHVFQLHTHMMMMMTRENFQHFHNKKSYKREKV